MEVRLLDLGGLTSEERTIILNVLQRDDEVRHHLEARIKQLKSEIHNIRLKSALRTGDDLNKMCARCHVPFGFFTNSGDICPGCHFRVCKNCRESLISHGWVCVLCFKENQIRWISGDWMAKTSKLKQVRATDLVRASLRIKQGNGRFSSDYTDYEEAKKQKASAEEETAFTIPNKTGNLGGLEERGSNESGNNSRRVEYPQDSDKRRLSTLLDSLRAGFGTGSQDGAAAAAAGGEVVVQHVSCRRRRDSNSSSESDSSEEVEAVEHGFRGVRARVSGRKGTGRSPQRAEAESTLMPKVSSACRLASGEPPSGADAARSDRQAKRSGGDAAGGAGAAREDGRERREGKRRLPVLPADARPKNGDAKSFVGAKPPGQHHPHLEDHLLPPTPALGDDDHSSGCSFTSSEWGEVTPTSPSRDASHPSDSPHKPPEPEFAPERREESSSGLDHSSGYMSFPRRNGDSLMTMMTVSDELSKAPPARSVSAERSLATSETRTLTGDDRPHVHDAEHQGPHARRQGEAEEPRAHVRSGGQGGALQHVRRHSSGRSDASLGSARTASPATKMRLLDLASHRALDRDGDSLRSSWSGGSSDDTLSLGMSCSGLRATSSPEVTQQSPLARGGRSHPQPPPAVPHRGSTAADKPSPENYPLPRDTTCCSSKKSGHENGFEKESSLDEKSFSSSSASPLPRSSGSTVGVVLSSSDMPPHFSLPTSGMHGQFPGASGQEETTSATGFEKTNITADASRYYDHQHVLSVDSESLRSLPGSLEGILEREKSSESEHNESSTQDASSLLALPAREVEEQVTTSTAEALSEERDAKALEVDPEDPVVGVLEAISPQVTVGRLQKGRGNSLMETSAGQVEDQEPLPAATVVPVREMPYTMQLFLQSDAASDTLSIISELSEPGEDQNSHHLPEARDEYLSDRRSDDDEEGSCETLCCEQHGQQSSTFPNHSSLNVGGLPDKEPMLSEGEDGKAHRELDVDVLVWSLKEEASSVSEGKQKWNISSRSAQNGKSDGDEELLIYMEKCKQSPQSHSTMTYDTEISGENVAGTSKHEGSGGGDKFEVGRANFAAPVSDGRNAFPTFEAFREGVYFADRDVQPEPEGLQKKADTEARKGEGKKEKAEESWGGQSHGKQMEARNDGGFGGEAKHHSLFLETKAQNLSPDIEGKASAAVGATVQQHLKKGQSKENPIPWEVGILDGEKACHDEGVEKLVRRASTETVQEHAALQNPSKNVTVSSAYVSSPVGKQVEAELVLEPSFSKKANLVVEYTPEEEKGDESSEDPSIEAEDSSFFQIDNKRLITGVGDLPATPELADAGRFGQKVPTPRDKAPDVSAQPKTVNSSHEVPVSMPKLSLICEPTTPKESSQIKPGIGRVLPVSPQLRLQDVPDGAESRPTPNISISRPADADSVCGSENSGSPEKRSPHRTSHLSIPSAATGSQSGSHDERSFDDDDDNIDELFAKHRTGSRLSAVRNNIGDSRESLASVYSNAGEINYGRIPVTGDIVFALDYDHRHSTLKIDVRNCQNIAPVDTKHNRSDPYVKVYLLPDRTRSGKRKTKIKKHTLNPMFNEVLTYTISRGELENRTLWVTVWHSDRFGRNDFLGEVMIPMDNYRFDDPSPFSYPLQSRAQEAVAETMQYKGELILSVMYVTPEKVAATSQKSKSKHKKSKAALDPTGEVHVMIKSASNLTAVRSNGASDPFVKGYLLPERARTGKQKTPVVKNSVNPMWNQILVFDGVMPEELADRSLELTVWDHEKLGTNEFLGGARLNTGLGVAKGLPVDWMDARGEEASIWQTMMERPNAWIDARLPLRASMGKPSKK